MATNNIAWVLCRFCLEAIRCIVASCAKLVMIVKDSAPPPFPQEEAKLYIKKLRILR